MVVCRAADAIGCIMIRRIVALICVGMVGCFPCAETEPTPDYCVGPPYSQLAGPNYWPWVESDCTGERARGALSQGLPCAQWPDGEVFCVDVNSPVEHIYFHDPNQGEACVEYLEFYEPWYAWRSCGLEAIAVVQ